MKHINKTNIIDIILIAVATVFIALIGYICLITRTVPFKWRIGLFAIFLLIYLIILVLQFKKLNGYKLWIRRFGVLLLCIVLGGVSFYADKANNSLKTMTNSDRDQYITISVVVNADSPIDNIEDLANKKVGKQDGLDKDNADYAEKKVNADAKGIKYSSENSYITLSEQLTNNDIDAMIITSSFLGHIDAEQEGYADTIKTIKTYKRKVTVPESEANKKDLTKEPFTILLSGVDTSDGGEVSMRSDVVMILIVNPLSNHVEMISVPRDSYIPNLALGGGMDKLTHTSNDGVQNTMDSLEEVIGFDIDFYVQINFTSVIEIVDAIGGIDVDVPIAFCEQDSNRSFEDNDIQCLDAGQQHLNGEQALALTRHRKSYGDLERTKAQQLVIQGMVNRLISKDGAMKVPALLDIVPKYVQTNISYNQLTDFINHELDNIGPWTFGSTSLENGASDMLTTASMGNIPLSCYLLSFEDVELLFMKYQMIINPTSFNKFSFNLSDLGSDLPKFKRPSGIIFAGDYLGNHLGEQEDYYQPEVETPEYTQPENNYVPPVEEPVVPVEPVIPVEPTPPSPENGDGSNNGIPNNAPVSN